MPSSTGITVWPIAIVFGIGCFILFAVVATVIAVGTSRDRGREPQADVAPPRPDPDKKKPDKTNKEEPIKNKFRRGERVRLKIVEPSARAIPAATDPRGLADAMRFGIGKDHPELKPLYQEGRLIDLPAGTKALVTDTGPFWLAIRADPPADRGRELFIPCEWADLVVGDGPVEFPPGLRESLPPQPKMPEPELKPGTPHPQLGVEISIAPPPRPVSTFPPPPGAWSSEWQQLGDVRVRVRAVRITRAPLVDAAGRRSDSPSVLFVVWLDL